MKLTSTVPVAVPPDQVFMLLNAVETVVGALPGASLEGRDGDDYRGSLRVKVGAMALTYGGVLRFLDVDQQERRLRLQGEGTDRHGNGAAEALIDVAVEDAGGGGSRLVVVGDVVLTGRVVALGSKAIGIVADRLLQLFAENLAGLAATAGAPQEPTRAAPSNGPVRAVSTAAGAAGAVDLDPLALLLGPDARRRLLLAAVFVAGMAEGWLVSRAFGSRR